MLEDSLVIAHLMVDVRAGSGGAGHLGQNLDPAAALLSIIP